ncbi:bifunctional DNA-formamidopyrimidine glycosylase/DNA-(apurinic or apyrimidinic site) lyase [Streptantibioticus rubrisoli]|uniref:Formamidopyrimidine-DNA glycosylase n=1 Tax=Streptantibioticus rubrisoli TaxID=1387313 RepID=A0ABT1PNA1_9ACTN|nr:bifunctional DNA-formamidopyrimidine glycosylase/DNA-(apurinic or apyrimidinic site) lyase [Streptantibioticus rubrisoli]MCQ4046068.1 bifunctional DNA-formamidopyrimidine glycosylase/DNA-(apurinic or apyrimidinic site) lyase [Streptantibioticus rubrisoli]
MPELPEVEVVRRGLERWVSGRTVHDVEVRHPRAVRRHIAGADDFADRLRGITLGPAHRRGKYLWLPLGNGTSLLGHLGMSGQLLVQPREAPDETHLRIRFRFADTATPAADPAGDTELRFVDQRTFGGLSVHDAVPDGPDAAVGLPLPLAHIAPDPLETAFDEDAFHDALRRRRTTIKRALLDQSLISGVGNIYADEALWRGRLHYDRPTAAMTRSRTAELVGHIRDVMGDALAAGGTSFDSLYVNVNGESGYFDRSLDAYGREGESCRRCGTPIRRRPWMNRSSYFCPRCQRPPRAS